MFHFELLLVFELSVDDQTIGFKGRHVDKMIISYQNEGGGLQSDAIFDQGYTYTFFLSNEGVPKEYMLTEISPLHAHVYFLLLTRL